MSKFYLRCLGSFEVLKGKSLMDAKELPIKWRTAKAQELFLLLLHYQETGLNKEELVDMLWPELDNEAAFAQLYATIYSIRESLSANNIPIKIENVQRRYKINVDKVYSDVDLFEEKLEELEINNDEAFEELKNILDIYHGNYLEKEYYSWTFNRQEKLQFMMNDKIMQAHQYLINEGRYNDAILLNIKWKDMDPELIFSYENLEKLYKMIGHKAYAERYRRYLDNL